MREFKFRAWDKYRSKWLYFPLKDFTIGDCGLLPIEGNWDDVVDYSDLENITQFTGLLDKNGVELYESDVLLLDLGASSKKLRCIVKWFDERASFGISSVSGALFETMEDLMEFCTEPQSGKYDCLDVIGNIHENPDLLKEDQA